MVKLFTEFVVILPVIWLVSFLNCNSNWGSGYAITVVENSSPVMSVTPSVMFVADDRGLPISVGEKERE